jgi:C4-type Zn-finger protein
MMSFETQSPGCKSPLGSMQQPNCPRCQTAMTMRQLSPMPGAGKVDEIVFGCDLCGAELKQIVSRA